jgi:hypothetical protein
VRTLPLALIAASVAGAPALATDEVPFEPSMSSFADAAACKAHLVQSVADARLVAHVAVEGPYEVIAGDVRAHIIKLAGSGHRITEHRCLSEKLSSRSWRHAMAGVEAEEAETIESMAAKAEWLKKSPKR